ncbi:MAG: GNAT family N-acetyltransferase [Flavobacteriia bacterium]|nr:GNAT family N-acetyltransferase [Flavobacteriia bacterium]
MLEIKSPQTKQEWEDYFDLRYRLLRQAWGQKKGSEKDALEDKSKHFGLYEKGKLLAVARLDVHEKKAQIRYFAVELEYHGKGIGKVLLNHIEDYCKAQQINYLFLQARENAVPFYLKHKYNIVEKTHLLFGSIQHFKMEKCLVIND